jgi:hypothetical protein
MTGGGDFSPFEDFIEAGLIICVGLVFYTAIYLASCLF